MTLKKSPKIPGIEESQIRGARISQKRGLVLFWVGNDGLDDTAATQVGDAVVDLAAITGNIGGDEKGGLSVF
ncbi:MAG: hypothetical protein Ct9H300mP19_16480 [Dehalococcoidia bacterium]|nr:MAG: hypothetical protein Ct9H300mP19_16480 [Dehalococcoidia bacterium]